MQGYHSALHCGVFRRNGGRESGSSLHFKHLTFLPINSQYKINIYIKSKNTTSLINQLYQKKGVFIYLLKLIPSNYFINDIAASSATIVTSGCNLKIVPGTFGEICPQIVSFNACALSSPLTTTKIFFARMIVPIPMLYACFGTSSADSKNRLLASIVLSFKSTQCVGSTKLSPGSLNPICPFLPNPRS